MIQIHCHPFPVIPVLTTETPIDYRKRPWAKIYDDYGL